MGTLIRFARRAATVLVAATSALVAIGVLPATAGETETFRFEPFPLEVDGETRRTFHVAIPVGTAIRDAVALTNKTPETRTFRVFAADAREDPDTGRTAVGSFGTAPTGVGAWITIGGTPTREITLAGNERAELSFEVARPADAKVGGLGALVAEEVTDRTGSGIDVSFRVAILVDARGDPGSDEGLRVTDLELDAALQFLPREATIRGAVENATSRPASVDLAFRVESLTGSVWELDAGSLQLDPGERGVFESLWLTVPETGAYVRVTAEATWAGGVVLARTGRIAIVPLWFPLVLVLATAWLVRRGAREHRAPV